MPVTATNSSGGGRVLLRAALIGTVLQLALVAAGHRIPAVSHAFAPAGMLISLVAGWLYGRWTSMRNRRTAVTGGLVAGAVCAFLGILESVYLGDVPGAVLGFGTAMSAVTGAIGGWFGSGRRAR
ncbi:MAG: hypothetical protein ACM3NQ_15295 [Bacteroidales bacterium]